MEEELVFNAALDYIHQKQIKDEDFNLVKDAFISGFNFAKECLKCFLNEEDDY